MAKRFTDSDKWKRQWFRELTPILKAFWFFILDDCDAAGVWQVDFKRASFSLNGKVPSADKIIALFSGRIIVLNDQYWFIRDFIEFQYGVVIGALDEKNKAHRGVLRILSKHGLTVDSLRGFEGAMKVLPSTPGVGVSNTKLPLSNATTLVRTTSKSTVVHAHVDNIDKDMKQTYLEFVELTTDEYQKLLDRFGEAGTARFISRLNHYIGSTGRKYKSHYHTILSWAGKDEDKQGDSDRGEFGSANGITFA